MYREAGSCKLQPGAQMPYFSLRGTDGRIYSAAEFQDAAVLVVVFTCNHCPQVERYDRRLIEFALRYHPRGVRVAAISSNDAQGFPTDTFERMVERSRELELPFPYLYDETQVAARAFDAACTPECFVFDRQRRLRFHGQIDDNPLDPLLVIRRYLEAAVEALLAGALPEAPLTAVDGCSIKWRLKPHYSLHG